MGKGVRAIEKVIAYTDGACLGNPGIGGWGVLLQRGGEESRMSGAVASTTNNRMELLAACKALQSLDSPTHVELVTDSQYVRLGMTEWISAWQRRGWRKADNKPVKNADLWKELLLAARPHKVIWRWVKGHSGNPGNTCADQLAQAAASQWRDCHGG